MVRMRTINEAYNELKQQDPQTAMTVHSIRILTKSGKIPYIRVGTKFLLNFDVLEDYLSNIENGLIKQNLN